MPLSAIKTDHVHHVFMQELAKFFVWIDIYYNVLKNFMYVYYKSFYY